MKFLRISFCVMIAFSVLAFGGVEEWAQAGLEVGAAILLIYWAIRFFVLQTEQIFVSPFFLPLTAFLLVVVAQLAFPTTASPYHTRVELQLLIAYLILMHIMSQVYLQSRHWRGLVWFLMGLGFFVCLLGILQQLTFNGKLYWFREMRYGGIPFGPYVSRTHFAGFAELVTPIALVPLVLGRVRRERLFLVSLFAFVPIIALVLAASRGGLVSFVVEMALLCVLLLVGRIRSKYVLLGGIVVMVALLAVFWIGAERVLGRFSTNPALDVTSGKRAAMRHDTWRIFKDHPILGTGLGTLQMVFPSYDSMYDGKIVNHSHNDYLEALAETGILGGVCCAGFLAILLVQSFKGLANLGSSFNSALNLSGLVGCCGLLVHSLFDFNLHIPANALLFFVAAHLATARIQSDSAALRQASHRRRSRKDQADSA
jgi:O-antigen ligase